MSTITSEFTKEQLIARINQVTAINKYRISRDHGADGLAMDNELFAIALASLEAEAVAFRIRLKAPFNCGEKWDYIEHRTPDRFELENCDIDRLYTAPPAPANAEPVAWLWSHRKHPSEVTLVRPEDDDKAEAALWSGWSCQALYAAPPEPVSIPESEPVAYIFKHPAGRLFWSLTDESNKGQSDVMPVYTAPPATVSVPDELAGKSFEYIANKFQVSISEAQWILVGWNAGRAAMLQGAEPVTTAYKLPEGWVAVPVEPTKEMIDSGWSYYMTTKSPSSLGVYGAMLAAAPQQEVK